MSTPKILFVDDEENVLRAVRRHLLDEGYEILTADSGRTGLEILERERVPVIVSDFRMPEMDGGEFLKEVCQRWPETIRLVLSGYADIGAVISAINEGEIYKFVSKPWRENELRDAVRDALAKYRTLEETRALAEEALAANTKLFADQFGSNEGLQGRIVELEFAMDEAKYYRYAFESSAVPLVLFTGNGRPVEANRAARELWPDGNANAALPTELVARVTEFLADASTPSRQDWILPLNGGRWRVLIDPLGGDCAEVRVVVAMIPLQ
jgi:two-component system NtrC family sensor kinase